MTSAVMHSAALKADIEWLQVASHADIDELRARLVTRRAHPRPSPAWTRRADHHARRAAAIARASDVTTATAGVAARLFRPSQSCDIGRRAYRLITGDTMTDATPRSLSLLERLD